MLAATFAPRRDKPAVMGPVHRVAGYTDHPGGAQAFGNVVTACGVTLPWGSSIRSTERLWISPTTGLECGECREGMAS